ncbi:MAG: hypothetical protein Q8P18_23525 [Pseudomonadota bacterium]|nr:hypothetical protein [Pseudomonadota bacterium]
MLLWLLACMGYSSGQVSRGELNCEWLDTCGELGTVGFDSVGSCKAAAASQPYEDDDCPTYDAGAMATCLETYRDAIAAEDCTADFTAACLVCG